MTTVAPPPTAHQQDANTRWYLEKMIDDTKPISRPDCGRWLPLVEIAEQAYNSGVNGNRATAVAAVLDSLVTNNTEFAAMLAGKEPSPALSQEKEEEPETSTMPALPESAQLPEGLSAGACQWLERYVEYSNIVSPEGYEDFHEAVGLWVLSTIAGRRVKIDFNKKQYTPLMILLVADSTLYAKSETADVGVNVLQASGLRWLLGSDRTTPQKLLTDMAGNVPKNYSDLDADKQYLQQKRLSMSAQRGWRYDEFGELVRAITKGQGVMEDLKGLLLQLDACADQYEYSTQSRGAELIEKPYLALLGCMTPPDIRNNAKSGSAFWSDGFWARFAFVTPPPDTSKDCPFDLGEIPVPSELWFPLKKWHERLGIPTISIDPKRDEKERVTGWDMKRGELPETITKFGEGVHDAWKTYRSALKSISTKKEYADFRASYGRLSMKAIRVAALLASLENDNVIEMRHFAKAQEVCERWRRSLHELYTQINHAQDEPSYAKRIEDEITRVVRKLEEQDKPPTLRDLARYLTRIDSGRLKMSIADMLRAKILMEEKTSHAVKYRMATEE